MAETGITEVFLNEAKEIITNLESDILTLEDRRTDKSVINSIFRYFHTLKGSSGIAGFTNLYEFTHKLESLFDRVRSEEIAVTESIIDLLLQSLDWIKGELFGDIIEHDSEILKQNIVNSMSDIITNDSIHPGTDSSNSSTAAGPDGGAGETENFFKITVRFKEDIFFNGIDPLMILEDLECHGEFIHNRVNIQGLPDFYELKTEKCYLRWEIVLKTTHDESQIKNVFLFVYEDNDIEIEDITEKYLTIKDRHYLSEKKIGELLVERGVLNNNDLDELIKQQEEHNVKIGDIIVQKGLASEDDIVEALQEQAIIKKKIEVSTVRVDSGKIDNLMNLLGEIVIGQASLHRIADTLEEDKAFSLKNSLYGLDRATREFQEQIMSIRMLPIGGTFDQFRRFVRDTAQNQGKEIKLNIEGGETELDKTVIEKIGDPLKHIIRNAIDHGIESADERVKKGKTPGGTIKLKAYHQEGNVYIDIIDDGRGINFERVKKKAAALEMISEEEEISKEKLLTFLFRPGFSTTEKVGELSGRGVGMDVVKTNIEELRGSIEIKSKDDEGTLVRIKLPLTLAIIEGMLIRIGNSIFIIPLLSVVETIQIDEQAYKTVEGQGELIFVRGDYISLIRLNKLFDINADKTNICDSLFVIVECDGERMGIMIDELIGQQQIVIKSVDSYITDSRAISGATILGDGRVSLIMDIHGLAEELKD